MAKPSELSVQDMKKDFVKPLVESFPGNDAHIQELDVKGLADVKFGRQMKDEEFLLRKNMSFINHGSYGTVPRRVMDVQMKYMYERESHLDMWFRLNARYYLDQTRKDVSDFIGADVDNLVMVANATTALNAVVKSYPFKAGDGILITSMTYGSIKLLCEDFTSRLRPDVKLVVMELNFPIASEDEVVTKYEDVFKHNPHIKMAIVDHITSSTAILMPVTRIIELCRKYDALAVIDGAHAVGQVPLNMKELGADIYTSNLHKWGYAPRGSCFLWFATEHSDWLHPPNTSWLVGMGKGKEFFDQGTRDHIPLICARDGLRFYNAVGGIEKITSYTKNLADQVKAMIEKELCLKHIDIPDSMQAPNMRIVKFPVFKDYKCEEQEVYQLWKDLFGPSDIFGILMITDNCIALRYSTQIYNDLDDFKKLVELLRKFIQEHAQ